MIEKFKTILIGSDSAKKAALRISQFDYLCNLPLSVSSFVNPSSQNRFQLLSYGWQWVDVPVFKTMAQALKNDQDVNSISIHYNAKHVLKWVKEVISFPQIKNIVILAEDVPEKDARELVFLAQKHKVNILGPSSLGTIIAGKGRIGEIGGDFKNLQLCRLNESGPVGIITKSGGISGELMWVVSQNSPGIRAVFQIGGDAFPATDFVWYLEQFARDPQTKYVVMAGEAGGDLEERAAEWYQEYVNRSTFIVHSKNLDEPVSTMDNKSVSAMNDEPVSTMNRPFKLIVCISGRFLSQMPKGQKFGHAGAKQEESGYGSAQHKIDVLKSSGAEVVEFEELGSYLKKITNNDL